MNEDGRDAADNDAPAVGNEVERTDEHRKTRSIRFSESEWEEVRNAAVAHELPAAEFVRERILTLVRGAERATGAPDAVSLGPLIERMFRYTWFLATERRDAMVREGREAELEKLVNEARAFQESLGRDSAD